MISVVIPAYNAEATIGRCLTALARQTVPQDLYEVIVVDDGSRDATRAEVRCHPEVRLVSQAHAGAAAARNAAVQEAHGEIILFTDADCEPLPDWVEEMSAPFADPEVAGAKGVYRTRQRSPVALFVQAEHEEKYDRLTRAERIDFIDTYSAAYRREVVLGQGGFDPGLPICEDQELSYRLASRGHRLVFAPKAAVYHNHQATVWGYAMRKLEIGRWKVPVHARHPAYAIRDSYTPWTQKAQLLLLPLLGLLGLGAALGLVPWQYPVVTAVAGLLTAAPLALRCARQGWLVFLLCPLLVLVRALALLVGVGLGLVGQVVPRAVGRDKTRATLWRGLGWGAALALASAATWLSVRDVQWVDLKGAFAQIRWPLLALALASVLCTAGAKAARWQVLLRGCRSQASTGRVFRVLLIGQMGNFFLPARMGDLARAALIGRQSEAGALGVLGTLVGEKALDSLMILLTLVGLAAWTPLPPWLRRSVLGAALVTGLLFSLLIVAALRPERTRRRARALIARLPPGLQATAEGWLARFGAGLGLLRNPGDALLSLIWSAVAWSVAALTNVLLMDALGMTVPRWGAWLVLVSGFVANLLPAVPARVGVFEYASILALAAAGVSQEPGLAFAIVLHLLVYGPPAILGPASMVIEGLNWHKLKRVRLEMEERSDVAG